MNLHDDPTVIRIPMTCQPEGNEQAHSDLLDQFVQDDLKVIKSEMKMISKDVYALLVKFAPQDRFHYQRKYNK